MQVQIFKMALRQYVAYSTLKESYRYDLDQNFSYKELIRKNL